MLTIFILVTVMMDSLALNALQTLMNVHQILALMENALMVSTPYRVLAMTDLREHIAKWKSTNAFPTHVKTANALTA